MTSSSTLAPLVCPKCNGEMRTYERGGVHVDQCRDCRGLFLDRGELERLVDLEAAFTARPAPEWTRPADDGNGHDRDRDRPRRDAHPAPSSAPVTHQRFERGEGLSDLAEMGGIGSLGSLAELGELFERDGGRRQASDPRTGHAPTPRRRGGLFRELFEGFGD